MEENESNVIEHLLEVENIASSFTVDAQNKASEILNSAKAKAEQDYLSKFNIQSAEHESTYGKSEKMCKNK